jgi:hypothetical protein
MTGPGNRMRKRAFPLYSRLEWPPIPAGSRACPSLDHLDVLGADAMQPAW